jgi:hypothetical protein
MTNRPGSREGARPLVEVTEVSYFLLFLFYAHDLGWSSRDPG